MKTFNEFLNENIDEMSNAKINAAYEKIRKRYSDRKDDKYSNITKNSGHTFYRDENYEIGLACQNLLDHIVTVRIIDRKTNKFRSIRCSKYKIGFFNIDLGGFEDVRPSEYIKNLDDNIIEKIIESVNVALKTNIKYDKFMKAFDKAAKKYEKFDESEIVDEGILGDKALRAARKVIRICFGDAWVDDEMLTVTDAADEIEFSDGNMLLYFMEQNEAVETFKKLANMFGSEIKNGKFIGGGGVQGEIKDFDYFDREEVKISEAVAALHKTFKSPIQLLKEGYTKITPSEALAIMNGNNITKHAFSVKFKRDSNGNQCWFKGPNVEVFQSLEDAYKIYPYIEYHFEKENILNMHDYSFDILKKNSGAIFFVKNGERSVDKWTLICAKKRGVQY